MNRIGLIAGIALCCMGVLLGLFLTFKEAAVLGYGSMTSITTYDRIEAGEIELGVSYYAHKRIMSNCINGFSTLNTLVRPADQREKFARECRSLAEDIIADSPADAFAWLIIAHASLVEEDVPAFTRAFHFACNAGKNEGWQAIFRIELLADQLDLVQGAVEDCFAHDLEVLLQYRRDVSSLGRRYWSDEVFRERLVTIVSRLSEEQQRRFLGFVRRSRP